MEAQRRQVILLADVPLVPYYHYCSQLVNGLILRGYTDISLLALFADSQRIQLDGEGVWLVFVRLQGATTGADSRYAAVVPTKKRG